MNFGFSEEQEELRKMVKRFLEEKSPESEVRRLMATPEGYDTAVWEQMAKELALQGLGIPEEFGGQGYGPVELYVVFEEMGAALFCAPVLLDRGARRQRGALRRHRRGQGGLPAGHRLGRDHRHGRADRRRRTVGPHHHLDDRERVGRRFRGERRAQLRHRRQHLVDHLRAGHDRQGTVALRRRGRREGRRS